ncbi:uncharacterized protein PAC_14010 [Phialocephala subalpina]|uniref:Uncharacterized protein n=1 Tax=Phialocephala subalpina TaxID=576137 RepID=A0A1L7XGD9_9HELO|nr:uncharacterized protein PAC_14010 [Phialocephala subalpina]
MGQPSTPASNAIIYLTYGAFLVFGCYVAWRLRHQSKGEWLSGNRTQTGQAYLNVGLQVLAQHSHPNISSLLSWIDADKQ